MKPWNSTDRFWSKVQKIEGDKCWVWTACKDPNGYGRFRLPDGRTALAHRVAYLLEKGEIPDGMELDHKCNNPTCVNPSHLRPCTSRENKWNRKHGKVSSSGLRGVTRHGRGWRAKISINGQLVYLGTFETKEEAHSAYCEAANQNFGEFANVDIKGSVA